MPLYVPPTDDEPVVVRGIGRHLELRHLKNKLREEKLLRERQVFRVEHVERFRRPEDGSTIVRPFLLSSPTGRSSRAVQQMQAAEEAELTFSPAINQEFSIAAADAQSRRGPTSAARIPPPARSLSASRRKAYLLKKIEQVW